MTNIDTVKRVYEAYHRGDIDGALGAMAADITWEHHPTGNSAQDRDVPYLRRRQGREAVMGFFQDISADFDMDLFRPYLFMEGDQHVAVVIEYRLTVRATGKQVHDEEIHLWGFDDYGAITSHRGFLDTFKAIDARSDSAK